MGEREIISIALWLFVGVFTTLARMADMEGDTAGSMAAGVLWPIYLPYRLLLIVKARTA